MLTFCPLFALALCAHSLLAFCPEQRLALLASGASNVATREAALQAYGDVSAHVICRCF